MRTYYWLVMYLLCSGITSITQAAEPAAVSATVPLFLHYHGQLTDGGGTPLSGPVALQLRITDANHTALYAEDQTVTAFAGAVSAVVGNGTEVNTGAVQGGVPIDVFTPGESRLLEVWVDGALHGDPAEIVSVPYAMWSQTALRVAPGGIGTEQLAPEFFDDFAPQLVASPAYQSALADVQSAATIGVNSTFAYSASTTLQGVLEDFDNAIKAREVKNVDRAGDTMTGKLVIEKGGLDVAGDVAVTGTVDGVDVSTRDDTLQTHIDADIAHKSDGKIVGENTLELTKQSIVGLDNSLGGEDIRDNSLVGADILDSSLGGADIGDSALTGADISDGSLTGVDVGDSSIAEGKLNFDVATQTELGLHAGTSLTHGAIGNIVGETTLTTELAKKMDASSGATTTYVDGELAKKMNTDVGATQDYVVSAINNPGGNSLIEPSPKIVAWGLVNCSVDLPAGSPCPVTGSYNIASVVRLPTNGEHLVTFVNGLKTAQYAAVATIINTDDEHNVSILSQAKKDLIVFAADPHWFSVMVVLNQ